MGFFSWKTQDTDRSIANSYSGRETFTVYMTDDKGNKWKEDNYEGYGVFGGKDYYELLAEMNGKAGRYDGISLAYSGEQIKYPNLSEAEDWPYIEIGPEICPDQGYFYDDGEEEECEEDDEVEEE